MPEAIVLGGGLVGSVMAADLASDAEFSVTVADVREDALERVRARVGTGVRTRHLDLSDPDVVRQTAGEYDIVLGALASTIGFQTLRAVIEAGKPFCDICFMPEDGWDLDDLAREHGVTAIIDCGVAPGMSNMMAGAAAARLDPCRNIEIYVGGLPRIRSLPFQYKAGFSPYDVIEEYVRPSRIVEHGEIVVREALSEPEPMDLPGVGTLEAFNTDGLRSLAYTLDVPFMKEKTLRYPGHIDLMRAFRETGLFSHEPVTAGDQQVRPIDLTSALLFPKWTYEEGEEDLTVMRVIADGDRDGVPVRMTWDLLDFYDKTSRATSMARTTALPCTIMARLVASGVFDQTGVITPEKIGAVPGMLDRVLDALASRGVTYDYHEETGVS